FSLPDALPISVPVHSLRAISPVVCGRIFHPTLLPNSSPVRQEEVNCSFSALLDSVQKSMGNLSSIRLPPSTPLRSGPFLLSCALPCRPRAYVLANRDKICSNRF